MFFAFLLVIPMAGKAQKKISGTSGTVSLSIKKVKLPPILTVSNIKFTDSDGNMRIDGLEESRIAFTIKNSGKGAAVSLKMKVIDYAEIKGLSFKKEVNLPVIQPGGNLDVSVHLSAAIELENGLTQFAFSFEEQLGFPPDPFKMTIETKAFQSPDVKLVDYQFLSDNGVIELGRPVQLKTMLQNIGQGDARNVKVVFMYPKDIYPNGEENFDIGSLKPGESRELLFEFLPNKLYAATTIPLQVKVSESWGRYGENKEFVSAVDAATGDARTLVDIRSTAKDEKINITTASLTADVDKNIPVSKKKYPHRYALVIGNEDYTRFQPGLDNEVNVPFAVSDARIFAAYAERTLGIPSGNIYTLENAIGSEMNREIDRLINIIKYEKGQAEVFVFYAGHGFPDETTKMAYLMPVDISGADVRRGISLKKLYTELSRYPSRRVTVFLDACFSGGGRDAGLLAARGVRIKAVQEPLGGKLVVFSASQGQQSALPYREKQHGMFTYFLLKTLQEKKGDLSYAELYKSLKYEVELNSIRINSKEQNPELIFSPEVEDVWREWRLLDDR